MTQKTSSSKHHEFVGIMENNQKGNAMRHKRNGSSNEFVKVTGRMLKEFHLFSLPKNYPASWTEQRVRTTHSKQAITSTFEMPSFECDTKNYKSWMLNIEDAMNFPSNVDFSGDRANAYCGLINLTDALFNCVGNFLTNYHIGNKIFKPWK